MRNDNNRREVEWNAEKDVANQRKHGVTFDEAATVFYDPLEITFPDPDHSLTEDRFLTIGETTAGRIIIVSHTERAGKIRLISARKPTRNENRFYEEA